MMAPNPNCKQRQTDDEHWSKVAFIHGAGTGAGTKQVGLARNTEEGFSAHFS